MSDNLSGGIVSGNSIILIDTVPNTGLTPFPKILCAVCGMADGAHTHNCFQNPNWLQYQTCLDCGQIGGTHAWSCPSYPVVKLQFASGTNVTIPLKIACKKCGAEDIWTSWRRAGDGTCILRWSNFDAACTSKQREGEHLHRGCRNCGFEWVDPCLDAPASALEKTTPEEKKETP